MDEPNIVVGAWMGLLFMVCVFVLAHHDQPGSWPWPSRIGVTILEVISKPGAG